MPSINKITFQNQNGNELAARLELPSKQQPFAYAIFAHCFTCSKNARAVKSISDCLKKRGIAVLRFDFTGLGNSEGDFANTNFSSNIQDLIAAHQYMSTHYKAPSILIGHSLGGAAVLAAATNLEDIKAVITIGAPSEPAHVQHLIQSSEAEILENGQATVQIGHQTFQIKKQFLENIQQFALKEKISTLGKALLILHSPQDRIVSIDNAQKIYLAAKHPKSFISLDGSDHLLSNKANGHYVGEVIASWVSRYVEKEAKDTIKTEAQVAVRLRHEDKYTSEVKIGKHELIADEPASLGGNDFGPTPFELVSAGLGACTTITLQMYASRKKWDLQEVTAHINHHKSFLPNTDTNERPKKVDHFDINLNVKGNLDEKQKARLLQISGKCPVHKMLHGEVIMNTRLEIED